MNRCIVCGNWLGFYGISQTKSEGWVRWSYCEYCHTYHKANDGSTYIGTTKVEPSKAIFRTGA